MPQYASMQPEPQQDTPEGRSAAADVSNDAFDVTRAIFDAAPIGLAMFDGDCKLVDCNKFVLTMLAADKDQFLNRFRELLPEYQPDGSKSVDRALDNMKHALNGETIVMEWVFRSPAGESIPAEATFTRVSNNGKQIGLIYIYDLRTIKILESNIVHLKSESEKIYYDPLTDIFNRRFFDENLDRTIKTLSRSGGLLSLMMIDIDNFKDYNDTYGHSAGDGCLKTVAQNLSKCITRADDFIARYGGDEFAVVLPNTDKDGALLLAVKMIDTIQSCRVPHKKNTDTGIVTISIGVTTGRVDVSHNAEDYIKRADEMLYLSKHSGRNKYSFLWLSHEV